MRYFLLICVAALSLMGGCCSGKCDGEPVVSPTVITDEKQDSADPVLPAYKPWWKECEK